MINIKETISNLNKRGFNSRHFNERKEAVEYIASQLKETTIGFGGSMTVKELDLFNILRENNEVYWHWEQEVAEARKNSESADVYITSANAIAQTGEIINIDGFGNRIASTLYGKKKVFFIVGKNKIAETYDDAIFRARNIAAPLNARRLDAKTPCASGELKCHDCSSPARICKGLVVLWGKMHSMEQVEVIIINEELGY